jgi:peptide/nickel transport system substrate-binding protein
VNARNLFRWLTIVLALTLAGTGQAYAQKTGGILKATHRGSPPSLSIHQEATINTVWPMMPVYNNLVFYDWQKPTDGPDTIVPELAESWFWSKDGKVLTFRLRRGVRWHDGRPFTSADVKDTFDVVRGASSRRMKLNPRKLYFFNVEDITTKGDYEVTFHLKRPQPSLLSMLATGYTPVHPAHIAPDELRTTAVGTGPFKLKSYLRDQSIELVKNPDYWRQGRPYLDGITYIIIKARPSRIAALQAGQVDIAFPSETNVPARDTLKAATPRIVFQKVAHSVSDNIIVNTRKPPFDNLKLRQAVNLAFDRAAMIKSVHQTEGAVSAGANLPPPYNPWGLPAQELSKMPGYGDPAKDKAQARKLLAEEGYGPGNPLKVIVSTRATAQYVDFATWALDQLKQVGIEGTLEQVETGNWHAKMARRDYQLGVNLTGVGPDDPDANFYENYACGSERNYSDYCNEEVMKMFDRASSETDFKKRLALVHEIDKKLQMEVARPIIAQRIDFFASWDYVKNLVAHHNIYNYGRMENVWLDK